jgi:hypothetical protein
MAHTTSPKSRSPWHLKSFTLILIILVLLTSPANSNAYSVLSHEAVVDSAWDDAIKPLLLKRFPHSTPEQLKEAHSRFGLLPFRQSFI